MYPIGKIVIEKDSHLQESNVLENKVEESSTAEVGSSFDPSTDTEDSTSPSDFTTSEINTKTVRTTTNRVTTTASFTTVELLTCEFEADENNYLFPNPENCSTFYMCSNGFAYLLVIVIYSLFTTRMYVNFYGCYRNVRVD